MNQKPYYIDPKVFRRFWNMRVDSLFARLVLRYLLTWGDSWKQRIALSYLYNREAQTTSLFDRLAFTYVLGVGLGTHSLCTSLVRAYLVNRGITPNFLFATLARAFLHFLRRRPQARNLFDTMARLYLLRRCDEAIYKGLSVKGLDDVFDLAQVEGINLIDRHFDRITKTRRAWETAKLVVFYRVLEAVYQENLDAFVYTAELGYWTGAFNHLRRLEKEAESD
uniref:Uncharacterized protein n=1 Tax=Diastatea micrantha TaxID=368674 RepID=A0A1Z2QSR7_9ASTR|nr:hypothetical protein Dias_mi1Pt0566 [Diastatea micrantha]ASA34522.1 hypothetical protein Dias_mi1Pt0566 [Diastatea micrantha]